MQTQSETLMLRVPSPPALRATVSRVAKLLLLVAANAAVVAAAAAFLYLSSPVQHSPRGVSGELSSIRSDAGSTSELNTTLIPSAEGARTRPSRYCRIRR